VTAGTIALTQGQRKVPIHTAKRVVGRKVYGGQNTYMPLRVNYSGVMPIIFAGAMLTFPTMLLGKIPLDWCKTLAAQLGMGEPLYMLAYAGMILFFSYFWVATQFNPLQIADDLKRNGGYIPGIRPGRPTAEFLDKTMTRITLIGAVFLTVIAVIPTVMATQFRVPWLVASFMGGTSLLIIVGVLLDTMRQVESHLLMRHYDGFLKKGRLRGRR
jgi:preprotein translocase subunit SecY